MAGFNNRNNNYSNNNYSNNRDNRNNNRGYENNSAMELKFSTYGYRDEKNNIRKELILKEAKDIANSLKDANLTRSQLRAFYGEVKSMENKIINQETFEKSLYEILLLDAKAAYKAGSSSSSSKIPVQFRKFIEESVKLIEKNNNYETFKDFTIFFEAIVGYFYAVQSK